MALLPTFTTHDERRRASPQQPGCATSSPQAAQIWAAPDLMNCRASGYSSRSAAPSGHQDQASRQDQAPGPLLRRPLAASSGNSPPAAITGLQRPQTSGRARPAALGSGACRHHGRSQRQRRRELAGGLLAAASWASPLCRLGGNTGPSCHWFSVTRRFCRYNLMYRYIQI
jgi:hypothetical protein